MNKKIILPVILIAPAVYAAYIGFRKHVVSRTDMAEKSEPAEAAQKKDEKCCILKT